MIKTNNQKYFGIILALALVFGVIGALPQTASAGVHYYDGYYDVPSYGYNISGLYNYNAPIYTTTPVVVTRPVYVSQPVYVEQPVIVQQPIYVQKPIIISQPVIEQPVYVRVNSPLSVSCSANTTSTSNGVVTWTAYPSGGNGYYDYAWSGTDIYSGGGDQTLRISYSTSGQKYASVTLRSNGQSITRNCSNSVSVSLPYYVSYQQPVYQVVSQPTYVVASNNNSGLDIGCYSDPANTKIDQPVTWNVEVKGSLAPYTYSWTGSEGLSGTTASVIKYYGTSGSKSAIVTVTSADGKTAVNACINSLTIASAKVAVAKKTTTVAKTAPVVVAAASTPTPVVELPANNNSLTAASLFSLQNVPWGWVAVLVILILFFTVIYLLFNKQKI